MLGKRLFIKSRLMQRVYQKGFTNPLSPVYSRLFASNVKVSSGSGETVIEQQNMYTPSKSINIEKGTFVVFDNTFTSSWKAGAPYEVKETVWKNSIAIIITLCLENGVINTFFLPTTFFAVNMFYRVASFMTRAVSHMELLNWGTKVKVTFKVGGSDMWDISNICCNVDEKALVETFAEPYLFPITVRGKGVYYFYGHGQRAIRDGELFRAIIHGKSINLE